MKKKLLVLFLCILISGLTNCILGSGGDWDFFGYHYYNAYAVLHGRLNIDLMPAGIQSYLNPFLDIINYLIYKTFQNHHYLLTFIQGLSWGVLSFLIYLISDFLFSKATEDKCINNLLIIFSTIVGATECIIVSEIGMSWNDITVVSFILFSLYLILKFIETPKFKYIILSGLIIGIATGCKLISGIFVLSLLLMLLLFSFKKGFKYNLKILSLYFAFAALGFLLIDGYWMYLLYQKFGNPFFPMFNGIFKSKYYANINYADLRFGNIQKWYKCLFYPLIWTYDYKPELRVCEIKFFDLRHSFAYFTCIFSFLIFSAKAIFKKAISSFEKPQIAIILFSIISYFLWINFTGILRYLMPVLSLSAVIIVIFVVNLKVFTKNKVITFLFLVLLDIVLNINYLVPQWGRLDRTFENIQLPVEANSVVFLLGRPISYVAANSSYKDVKFIFMYYGSWDGENLDFVPTEEYYKLVDSMIKGRKKYIIKRVRRDNEYISLHSETDDYEKIVKKRYLNSKMKCIKLKDKVQNSEEFCMTENFDFCELED